MAPAIAPCLRVRPIAALSLSLVIGSLASPPVSAATTFAQDGFSRTVSGGWGSAGTGGKWWVNSPTADYSVANGRGRMTVAGPGQTRSALLTADARDVELTVTVTSSKEPTGSGSYVYLGARRDGDGSEYLLGLRITLSTVYLRVVRDTGSGGQQLGSDVAIPGVDFAPGGGIVIRAQVTGTAPTTIRLKAWSAAAAEPSGWRLETTDAAEVLQDAGGFSLRSYLSSTSTQGAVGFTFDDYLVTHVDAPIPAGRYVSTAGSDANDGAYSRPWRTLQHAADSASGLVNIRGGSYAGFVLKRSGLTFAAYPGETVSVSGGVDVIRIDGVDGATILGLTVRDAQGPRGAGILVASSRDVLIEGNILRENRSYGVRTWNAQDVTIRANEVARNDEGIRISYASNGIRVLDNDIHHNNAMIDPSSPDKGGGVGVVFLKSTGSVRASGNRLWGNRAPDPSHGYDGGGFEIFGASDVTITGNILWDNKHVLETGTADGFECARNQFSRNIAYAASSVAGYARGLLFACMSDSDVANNVLHGFDQELIAVVRSAGYQFQGSLDALRVRNNILVSEGSNIYYFDNVPATVVIDRNLIWARKGDPTAYVVGTGAVRGYASIRSVLGYERNGVSGDPLFVDLAARDYHVRSTSPAIDRGAQIAGITDGFLGSAPDVGRFEAR